MDPTQNACSVTGRPHCWPGPNRGKPISDTLDGIATVSRFPFRPRSDFDHQRVSELRVDGGGPFTPSVIEDQSLASATWPEIAQTNRSLVLAVPVGSLEQHGPHLPLDTDTQIALALVSRIALVRPWVIAAPALAFGASGEHADFPGTLGLNHDVLSGVLVELVRSARRAFRGVLVVSAHGGNEESLARVEQQCAADGDHLVVCRAQAPDGDAHAGRTETSLMLALAPERVHLDRLQPGCPDPLSALLPRLKAQGVRAVSANGVLGNPQGANPEEGVRLLDAMVSRILTKIDAFARDLAGLHGGAEAR
jgi:mycofactocin system creatininase family protein